MATTLTINAKVGTNAETSDTVAHYDAAGKLVVENMYTASYHEYGTVAFADIQKGRVVAETGGHIEVAIVTAEATVAFAQENGGTIGVAYATSEDNKNTNNADSTKKELTYLSTVIDATSAEAQANDYKENEISNELSEQGYAIRIGTTTYDTLESAVNAAKIGDKIIVLKDVDAGNEFQPPFWMNSCDIDFNGHSFTTSSTAAIWKSGAIIVGLDSGEMTISNATIYSKGTGIFACAATLDAGTATLTLENCNVYQDKNFNANTDYCTALRVSANSSLIVNSGHYEGYVAIALSSSQYENKTIINGGYFDGKINVNSNNILQINGGTFVNTGLSKTQFEAYVQSGHTVTESNGAFIVK